MDDTIILMTFLIYAADSRRKCHVDVESTAQKFYIKKTYLSSNASFSSGILERQT